jgi:lipopolysaccharide export system permease protein
MSLINRYILSTFGRIFLLSLAAFAGLYLLIDFFERVDDFIEYRATPYQYIFYFLGKVPLIVSQVAPLAVLMGVFMTLGGLSRNNELNALRASGISLVRIATPLLGVALLISVAVLTIVEYVVPITTRQTNYILETELKGRQQQTFRRDRIWLREGQNLIHVRLAVPEEGLMRGVTFYQVDEEFGLRRRLDADLGRYQGGGRWLFEEVVERTFDSDSGELATLTFDRERAIPFARVPDDFRAPTQKNVELGFRELRRAVRRLHAEGYDATRYRVDMHSRLAVPFASLIMALLGIPFALQKGRGASFASGIAITIGIGAAFHIINATITAFGYSAVLPPLFAAWSANLLFGMLGVWLLLSSRQ